MLVLVEIMRCHSGESDMHQKPSGRHGVRNLASDSRLQFVPCKLCTVSRSGGCHLHGTACQRGLAPEGFLWPTVGRSSVKRTVPRQGGAASRKLVNAPL